MKVNKPVILVILDGWGIGEEWEHNPIFLAHTPNIDDYLKKYPHTHLQAGGEGIGLIKGHQGSSEIGHLIIGAGRNVLLPQNQVTMAVESDAIKKNPAYLQAMENCKKNNSALHLMGLLSDKGVHSYDSTCHSLIKMAADMGIKKVFVHIFTDGRDTDPKMSQEYIEVLENKFAEYGVGQVATVMGRFWSMDRDHRWERIEKAYLALVKGHGLYQAKSAKEAVVEAYKREETDEFIKPTIIVNDKKEPLGTIQDNDSVVLFNFRTDRAIEISQAFIEKKFEGFVRSSWPQICYVATCEYYNDMLAPVAFPRPKVKNSLGEYLSSLGAKQLRMAETEKWVYLTTIFNGMREEAFQNEDRILVPSDKVETYDLAPEMQAKSIAQKAIKEIPKKEYQFIVINFANPDILGHTAIKKAIIKGIETVDFALGQVVKTALANDYQVLVTSDHGDAEIVWDQVRNAPHTAHTDSDVPCFIISNDPNLQKGKVQLREDRALRDVAPTVLKLMGLEVPTEMSGKPLF